MPTNYFKQVKLANGDVVVVRDDNASHYLGKTTTTLVDGVTSSATVSINGDNVTAVANDWVRLANSNDSFIYTGSVWAQFAAESTYAVSGGTGISIGDDGKTINHSNSVTADTTEGFKTFTYDAQGHITASTAATEGQVAAINSGITATKVGNYDDHLDATNNPHSVTAEQVGLGNLTNDKQIKGLASGTTSGDIVTFGADGYTVADSGVAIATSIPGTGAADTAVPTSKAVADYVASQFSGLDALIFKGTLGTGGTATTLPATDYEAGWVYRVVTAGTYAGQTCEVGDLIICVKDYASATASNDDWTVAQTNIDGAVTSSATSVTDGQIPVFDGTSGSEIKNSGKSIVNTYTADGTDPITGTGVTAALATLDVTGEDSIAASKTISAWSETDGKVSITTQDIAIASSQVTDLAAATVAPVSAINTAAPGATAPTGTATTLVGYDSTTDTLEFYQVGVATTSETLVKKTS